MEGTDATRRWLGRDTDPTAESGSVSTPAGDAASPAADQATERRAALPADPKPAAKPSTTRATGRGRSAKGKRPGKRRPTGNGAPSGAKDGPPSALGADGRRIPVGARHQARMLALMVLYETDLTDHPTDEVIGRTVADPASVAGDPDAEQAVTDAPSATPVTDGPTDPSATAEGGPHGAPSAAAAAELAVIDERVRHLVAGVHGAQPEIDPIIAEAAPAFPVAQLPGVDRNVLRLAIYELLHEPEVPVRAAINEAVELAKRFGGDSSGRFVNGVLRTVSERVDVAARRPDPAARPAASRRRPS